MKRFKKYNWLLIIIVLALLVSCKTRHNAPQQISPQYTCPMPTDSFFSNTPGKCPKCGMELIKIKAAATNDSTGQMQILTEGYTCPMHPQVHSDTAGSCPLCGMQLEKIKSATEPKAVSLDVLIKPVNQQVIASIPMVHMMDREEDIEMESYGFVTYDTREVGTIASYITGRIEKLYIHYRFQKITKGQKLMDIYSPEILTAQENLLFLLKNDRENENLITAAKQKLRLLGMSNQQLAGVIQTGKAVLTISVFSNYSGHIHESNATGGMINVSTVGMKDISITTTELSLKEGMYVQKGQNMFTVFNPAKAWVVLNIFAEQASMVKVGNKVRIVPETAPVKDFRAAINYIEPVYRPGTKTLSARVYFDNATLKIPIGSQVKATLFGGNRTANWLPEEAVLSLGLDKVVFVWTGESFTARKIETGIINKHLLQILNGIDKNEAVAANAQYLVDSESFIKTK